MSVVNPTIDDLLSVTDENRFLLCEIASRRARDINDMMRNQHNRAEQLADIEDITMYMSDEEGHAPNPLSIAFNEIAPKKDAEGRIVSVGDLSFDERALDAALGMEVPEEEPEPAMPAEDSVSDDPAADEAPETGEPADAAPAEAE